MAPLVFVIAAVGFWFNDAQDGGPYVLRNLVPPLVVLVLAAVTLWRGGGHWTRGGFPASLTTDETMTCPLPANENGRMT